MSNYIAKSNLTKLFRSSDRKTQPGVRLETFLKTTYELKTRTCVTNEFTVKCSNNISRMTSSLQKDSIVHFSVGMKV